MSADERRVEVAAEALRAHTARDLGECCARAVVAALDALDRHAPEEGR